MGVLAMEDQRAGRLPLATSHQVLARWAQGDATRAKYEPRPAAWFLDHAERSGLISIEDGTVSFAHPLLSAFLAADAIAAAHGRKDRDVGRLGRDARVLAAVLTPADQTHDVLATLRSLDVFALASVVRLASPIDRTESLVADIARFDRALAALADAAGRGSASNIRSQRTAACRFGDFIALRRVRPADAEIVESQDLTGWVSPGDEFTSYTCWLPNPFSVASPELLAAAEIVAEFKAAAKRLQPRESPWAPFDTSGRELLIDKEALTQKLLDSVTVQQTWLREALGDLNLLDSPLAATVEGNPRITVRTGGESEPTFETEWGDWEPGVRFLDEDPARTGTSLSSIAGDARARAWVGLARELEDLLESSLSSQAPAKPTRFPGWIV
jgi:hypothetical protein